MPEKPTDLAEGAVKLLEALSSGGGIKRIIEIGYEMLENPISLVDTSRKTIVLTNSPEVEDDLTWQELAKDGYFSSHTIKHNYSVGLTKKLATASKPFFWARDNYIKYNRLISPILYKNKTIGILAVMESKRPFRPSDLEIVSILSNAISSEMQKNIFIQSASGIGHEEFIRELLDGKIKNAKVVKERAENLNLSFKKNLFVLVSEKKSLDKSNMFPLYLRKSLEQIIASSISLEYKNHVVLLLSCSNIRSFLENELPEIENYFSQYKLSCGLSNSFTELANIRIHYEQASAALKLGRHFNSKEAVFKYKDYIVYHFMDICSQYVEINRMIHPVVLRLIDFDKQNGTDYLNTLYAFLKCGRSIPQASKILNVHRNSMTYRMKKIGDIMDVDFSDSDLMLLIELSFKLLEYEKSELINMPNT